MTRTWRQASPPRIQAGLIAAIAALVSLTLLAIATAKAPSIQTEFGGATVEILADRAWILPGACLTISWDLEGIHSLYIDGNGKIGWGELDYCPSWRSAEPQFEITAQNGELRVFALATHYLPSEMISSLLLTIILFLLGWAGWMLANPRLEGPPPAKPVWLLLALAALWLLCLLSAATGILTIQQIMSFIRAVFISHGSFLFGLILAALVFIPLLIQALRTGIKTGAWPDFMAVASFLAFLLLLNLPFGFDSIAQWEGWVTRANLDGNQSAVMLGEYLTRFWGLLPYMTAKMLSPDSFVGDHLLQFALLWGMLALFYGILRRLGAAPWAGFLCAMLFIAYPVNPVRLPVRYIGHVATTVALLAALYFTLDFLRRPERLRLAGIWLAMAFHLGTYDAGYALILVFPLVWHWKARAKGWKVWNATAIWLLPLAAKAVYVLMLFSAKQTFRGSELPGSLLLSGAPVMDLARHYAEILGEIYWRTFALGWEEALAALSRNHWMAPTLAILTLTGAVALLLSRGGGDDLPTRRQAAWGVGLGLLLMLPAEGVFLWLEKYNRNLVHPYILVPIAASVAIFSIVAWVAAHAKKRRLRVFITITLCLLLLLPAIPRLFVQVADFEMMTQTKAGVLRKIVEQAPRFQPDALLILLTDMGLKELGDNHIYGFRRATFNSAMWILYQEARPSYGVLCWDGRLCNAAYLGWENYDIRDVVTDAGKLVLMRLHEDLRVELLRELPPELGIANPESYDPDALIDFDAPLPKRAFTMLGADSR